MLDQLKALFAGAADAPPEQDLRTAVAALLVEAAWSADGFAPAEQNTIECLLRARFGISTADARSLMELGDRAGRASADVLRFIHRILNGMAPEQRIDLVEMLWDVAFADGQLDPEEERLIAKIAGLLYVSPSERNAARRRAMTKVGLN